MNNTLHIIDDSFDPNPRTVKGTKDLVEMFWTLNPNTPGGYADSNEILSTILTKQKEAP
jgi:hypothetical protein